MAPLLGAAAARRTCASATAAVTCTLNIAELMAWLVLLIAVHALVMQNAFPKPLYLGTSNGHAGQ